LDEQRRTSLVFDTSAPLDEREFELMRQTDLNVLFAVEHETADEQIAELLAHHSAPRQVVVISNDRQVQLAATRRQAQYQLCEAWYDWLERRETLPDTEPDAESIGGSEEKPSDRTLSESERDYWLREFGSEDV
jgi:predicted RNA-binding protein with PIN domain